MVDPASEQKLANYTRLLADSNELFDFGWLSEELTELLFSKRKFATTPSFAAFNQWHQSWYNDANLYFASQYLLSYHDALREMEATVNEEMPYDYYEDKLKELLWAFVSTETGKAWRHTKQSAPAEERTHRWKLSAKFIFSQHNLHKDDEIRSFFLLLHSIAITNDVLSHRAKRHGLMYNKTKPESDIKDPITAFCEYVKSVMRAFSQRNGEVIKTNAKGVAGQYTFHVDADKFDTMMTELKTNYDYLIKAYLADREANDVTQLTLVCPFVGFVLSKHIISTPQLQKTDLEPTLLQFYPGKKSVITKLSSRSGMPEEQKLFRVVESILEAQNEH